jgi:hypothetical protein
MSKNNLLRLHELHENNYEKIHLKLELHLITKFLNSIKTETEELDMDPNQYYDSGKITFIGCESKDMNKNVPFEVINFCDLVISVARRYIKSKLGDDPNVAQNWLTAYENLPFLTKICSKQGSISKTQKSYDFSNDVKEILGLSENISNGYLQIILDKLSVGGNADNVKEKDNYIFTSRTITKENDTYVLNLEVFCSLFVYSSEIIVIHSNCSSSNIKEYTLKMDYSKTLYTVVYTNQLYELLKEELKHETDEFFNDL